MCEAMIVLKDVSLLQRILLTTDGTLTHILEAYAGEPIHVVKLSHSLVSDGNDRGAVGARRGERVLLRSVLLRGRKSEKTFIYAESEILLDRLPRRVVEGLLYSDTPIGRLFVESRTETFREVVAFWEGQDAPAAAHLAVPPSDQIVSRSYRIVTGGLPVAWITEKFPKSFFQVAMPVSADIGI